MLPFFVTALPVNDHGDGRRRCERRQRDGSAEARHDGTRLGKDQPRGSLDLPERRSPWVALRVVLTLRPEARVDLAADVPLYDAQSTANFACGDLVCHDVARLVNGSAT